MGRPNGADTKCGFSGFSDDFEVVREHVLENTQKMDLLLVQLKKLDFLETMNDNLLSAATGRDHVPLEVVVRLIRVLGALLTASMGIIVFLLIGGHFDWWRLH